MSLAVLLSLSMGAFAQDVPKQQIVNQDSNGATVSLAEDEVLVVVLPAQLSTGFMWDVKPDRDILTLVDRDGKLSSDLGGSDIERLSFKGVSAGTTMLEFSYVRTWEVASTDIKSFTLKVNVVGAYIGSWEPAAKNVQALSSLAGFTEDSEFDWCKHGKCTPIKNQGSCGSCWAFATTGVVEQLLYTAAPDKDAPNLSEQYLVSCNTHGWGCRGGLNAFGMYINEFRSPPETDAGMVYTKDFVYTASDTPCGTIEHPKHEKLDGWTVLDGELDTSESIKDAQEAIKETGPLWVTVCADSEFQSYRSGIFKGNYSCGNHAVVLTGWGHNSSGQGYWILRNSWGMGWGEGGYMRIAYGANRVGYWAVKAKYTPPAPPPPKPHGCSSTDGPAEVLFVIFVVVVFMCLTLPKRR